MSQPAASWLDSGERNSGQVVMSVEGETILSLLFRMDWFVLSERGRGQGRSASMPKRPNGGQKGYIKGYQASGSQGGDSPHRLSHYGAEF